MKPTALKMTPERYQAWFSRFVSVLQDKQNLKVKETLFSTLMHCLYWCYGNEHTSRAILKHFISESIATLYAQSSVSISNSSVEASACEATLVNAFHEFMISHDTDSEQPTFNPHAKKILELFIRVRIRLDALENCGKSSSKQEVILPNLKINFPFKASESLDELFREILKTESFYTTFKETDPRLNPIKNNLLELTLPAITSSIAYAFAIMIIFLLIFSAEKIKEHSHLLKYFFIVLALIDLQSLIANSYLKWLYSNTLTQQRNLMNTLLNSMRFQPIEICRPCRNQPTQLDEPPELPTLALRFDSTPGYSQSDLASSSHLATHRKKRPPNNPNDTSPPVMTLFAQPSRQPQQISWDRNTIASSNPNVQVIENSFDGKAHYFFWNPEIFRSLINNDELFDRFAKEIHKLAFTRGSENGLKRLRPCPQGNVNGSAVLITYEVKLKGTSLEDRILCYEVPADDSALAAPLIVAGGFCKKGLHTGSSRNRIYNLLTLSELMDTQATANSTRLTR